MNDMSFPMPSRWSPRPAHSALLARNWWAIAARGVAALAFGAVAFTLPGVVLLGLLIAFAAYLLVDGALALAAGLRAARHHERSGPLLVEGALNGVTGLVVLFFPFGAVIALVFVAAAWALLTGAAMLAAGARLHGSHGRGLLLAGGAISVLWGVMLVIAPLLGAVVLAWWLGLYAVLFGVTLLALAFRLRPHRRGAAF